MKKKLYKVRQLSQGAVLSVVLKLLRTNAKANLNSLSEKDLLKAIKTLSTELTRFENLSPALLQAEKVCEIQCLEAISNCLVRDAEVDSSRNWVAERFMYKAIPRINYLKTLIEQDDEVLAERLSEWEDPQNLQAQTGT